ncbi:MAG: dipeptidase [Chloroflexi bacterium]|nr:dipeptidase [Chloroflexota bacterium]
MPGWESYLKEHRAEYVDQLMDFVRIPSISALSEHFVDVRRAAQWAADRLKAAGVNNARVIPTGEHALAYGEWLGAPGKPTFLLYGHLDVQPVDPLDLWTTPPFEPVIRDGRMYGRGASDDKSGVLLTIIAVEALLKTAGTLPVNVKFVLEGQEEVGSLGLADFVVANHDLLKCDAIINADGLQWSENQPALLVGLRGVCAADIGVLNASADLHSGLYGGAIANPLHALAELMASFHSPDGRIAVEGFYDDVVELSPEDKKRIDSIPFDESEYKARLGVDTLFGEPGYSTLERVGVRPTCEINGMWGGFQGEGMKTVLPKEAHAKITCRLVPNQEPAKILDLLEAHVKKHKPQGVKVAFHPGANQARPYLVPTDQPINKVTRDVLVEVYGKEPFFAWEGGSVPICDVFLRELGAYSISFGFILPDEQFHAPDEFFRLSSFERGQVAFCKLLERL